MILIQVILLGGFILLMFHLLSNPNSHQIKAWQKILGCLFVLVAVFIVLLPEVSNDAARAVGVGRGADLLLYMLTLAFIFVVFNLYLKNKQEQRRTVQLARKLAIIEANSRQPKL